ncbi:MAG: DinB family protein, partial [Candidatus Xenobia bacterium]
MDHDKMLRQHLDKLLAGGQAHTRFEDGVAHMPFDEQGARIDGYPHSAWELLEHLRIAQWDILDFSRNPEYQGMAWPQEYWPKTPAPPDQTSWKQSVAAFQRDHQAMRDLVMDPKTDLYAKIPWGDGQTVLREVLLVADHNAYHLG